MAAEASPEPATTCGLCRQPATLRNSHILPAFVFRWLRETSATGHIRSTDNIDQRVQDGEKKPWLCADCENLLSRDERAFATKLFHPWQAGAYTIEYQAWLQRFCVSVSWRVLTHCKGKNPDHEYTAQEDRSAADAELVWRDYLLGRRTTIGKFVQHLLPFDVIESATIPNLPDNINRYLTRHVDMDIIGSSKMMMTFAKLGGLVIFGTIRPHRKWEGTRVFGEHGRIAPGTRALDGGILNYLMDRARMVRAAQDKMSEAQVAKVDAALLGNIERVARSPHMRAVMADAAMFGEQAILRTSRKNTGTAEGQPEDA